MKNKVINNTLWIIAGKIVQALLNLLVTMLSARYLGPSGYGTINYAASVVAFTAPMMQLGLNATLVMELIRDPNNEGRVMGTAMTMSFVSSFACILGVIAFSLIANRGERQTIMICGLYSISLIFQSIEKIQYWFQAKLLSKYTAGTMLIAYIFVSAYKIVLLISGGNIYWFAISQALDYAIIASVLLVIYRRLGGKKLCFSKETAKSLFSRSRYYIVSSLMVTFFSQTSRIMLKLMVDEAAVGYYSAAVSCVGMTGFVFSAIIDSARPSILEGKAISQECFVHRQELLYSVVIYLSLLQNIFVVVFAKFLVKVLYGEAYLETVSVMRVIAWYTTFSYLGSVRNIWILAEQQQRYLWIINLSGAAVNVTLNFLLIPRMGILGAAWTTLITQFFTNVVTGFLLKPIRKTNWIMLNSLNYKVLMRGLKKIFTR